MERMIATTSVRLMLSRLGAASECDFNLGINGTYSKKTKMKRQRPPPPKFGIYMSSTLTRGVSIPSLYRIKTTKKKARIRHQDPKVNESISTHKTKATNANSSLLRRI
jgi:hypothetical protein